MIQRCRELDLLEEPLGTHHRGQVRTQHLERDPAFVLEVAGQEYGRHAPAPELALDFVLAFQTGSEEFDELGHGSRAADGEMPPNSWRT